MPEQALTNSEIARITLEKLRVGMQTMVNPEVLGLEPHIDTVVDHCLKQIVISFQDYIWAEHLETVELRCPADWKQSPKERFAPRWFLKRWPVRERVQSWDVKAKYPTLRDQSLLHVMKGPILGGGNDA